MPIKEADVASAPWQGKLIYLLLDGLYISAGILSQGVLASV
jgi:hypothetical protein